MVFTIVINKLLVGFYTLNSLNQNQIIFFFTHAFTNDIKSLQMKFKVSLDVMQKNGQLLVVK